MKRLFGVLLIVLVSSATADQVCQSVYNPMENRWEYQCVERPRYGYQAPPVCRQEYDAFNNRWITVCD